MKIVCIFLLALSVLISGAQPLTYRDPAVYIQNVGVTVNTNGIIPFMTSTNSPSGVVLGDGWYWNTSNGGATWNGPGLNSALNHYVFDTSDSTVLAPPVTNGYSAYVIYKFSSLTIANQMYLSTYGTFGTLAFNISASIDNVTYIPFGFYTNDLGKMTVNFSNTLPFLYYKFSFTTLTAGFTGVREIQLYNY